MPMRAMKSAKFKPAARTRTRIWPWSGMGSGYSRTLRVSGAPCFSTTIAFMVLEGLELHVDAQRGVLEVVGERREGRRLLDRGHRRIIEIAVAGAVADRDLADPA